MQRDRAMAEYLLLMHDDATVEATAWEGYIRELVLSGVFRGGSAIGDGVCARKDKGERPMTPHLSGFMRIEAESLEQARAVLAGNPVYEAGGTVEIRELPRSD